MSHSFKNIQYKSAREKFLGLSLESTRKSYYPQLQEQLESAKDNEHSLQLLIDNLPARISCVDVEEKYLLVNSEYMTFSGMDRSQIVGRKIEDIIGSENYSRKKPFIHQVLSGKHVHFDMEFTTRDNKQQWNEVSFVPVLDHSGQVSSFYILARNVTEKRNAIEERAKLEASLQDTQKFKAIGTLAGGIAHDFNNILMGIQGRASLMSVAMEHTHPIMEHISAIEEYVEAAANLTKQLLGFARGGKYEVKPTDLISLLTNSSEMFGRTHKEIIIHHRIETSPLVSEVDPSQINQVLLNLYVNAWQAMPDGGNLYLDTKTIILDAIIASAHDVEEGSYAKISVTDTGTGMSQETCKRVFDPFFTTKEKQRGTGLGLASAYGIVKNHSGFITVYSEINHGTTFTVFLPLSENNYLTEKKPIRQSLTEGSETILLVDDEKMVVDVGQAMLKTLGYHVITSENGEQAVGIISEDDNNSIDLVILDMIMPNMGGGEAFDKIRQFRQDLPVLLSSGYSVDGQADEILQRGCNGFIQKPFSITELSKIIRTTLDE